MPLMLLPALYNCLLMRLGGHHYYPFTLCLTFPSFVGKERSTFE